jgi:hypothetical protein
MTVITLVDAEGTECQIELDLSCLEGNRVLAIYGSKAIAYAQSSFNQTRFVEIATQEVTLPLTDESHEALLIWLRSLSSLVN